MHNCKGKKSNAYSIQVRAADILLFKKACCVVIYCHLHDIGSTSQYKGVP